MLDEKQIEKMSEDIASMLCEAYRPDCDEYQPRTCSKCYVNSTPIGCFAEMLYNAGYRKQEWISVDERLPERQGYYLGCTYKGLMMIAPFFPVYADDKPEFRYDISHWMPLPEAPKMKGGAE